jgi:hypothetical protein
LIRGQYPRSSTLNLVRLNNPIQAPAHHPLPLVIVPSYQQVNIMGALRPHIASVAREYGHRQLHLQQRGCVACRTGTKPVVSASPRHLNLSNRPFSSSIRRFQDQKANGSQVADKGASSPAVHAVPDENLPSHRERSRYTFSKKTHAFLDNLMLQLGIATQRINNYTGTDYSGIEALRREIKDQGMELLCDCIN